MQKAQEQQLFVLPPGEEIPGDEIFRFGPQFFAEAGKNALGSGVVGSDLPDGVEVSRSGVQMANGISCWRKLSNTQQRKPSKLPSYR